MLVLKTPQMVKTMIMWLPCDKTAATPLMPALLAAMHRNCAGRI